MNRRYLALAVVSLAALVVLLIGVSVSVGALNISLSTIMAAVLSSAESPNLPVHVSTVIFDLRLPRAILAVLVGATLAICGAVMQGMFRNPLADPGIIGVSSGAAVGAIIAIVFFPNAEELGLVPIFAFIAGLATTLIVYRVARHAAGTSVTLLLLSGIAIAALASAIIGFASYFAADTALRSLSLWQMGSLAGADAQSITLMTIGLIIILARFMSHARALDALSLGESEARYLGIKVERLKLELIVLCAMGVGLAVSVSGIIGFIGLVVPHMVRMLSGPSHRSLLPLSALTGAALMLISDVQARIWLSPAELPVGLVTALVGAPFFVFLIIKQRKLWS
jgi:iron complex transport system permease protein